MKRVPRLIPSICTTLLIAGCSSDLPTSPDTAAPRTPSPMVSKPITVLPGPRPRTSRWVRELSNPWLGFEVGKIFYYRAQTPEGIETTVVEVTSKKKMIQGVSTTVVHDQVSLNGSVIEDTYDWYAQDVDGTVWYFGEDSRQFENNVQIGTEGSWEAGVNDAQPGIVMLANPKVGMQYQQEFAAGVAEDMARIRSLSESVQVPYGSFDNCLETLEWTPLDKKSRESKFYARGVGLVLTVEGKGIRDELIPTGP